MIRKPLLIAVSFAENDVVVDDEWRLTGQERYLRSVRLRWRNWWSYRADWDHDHCEFCHAEISDRPIDGHTEYNAAWVTDDDYHWICPRCFDDFRERFDWKIAIEPDN